MKCRFSLTRFRPKPLVCNGQSFVTTGVVFGINWETGYWDNTRMHNKTLNTFGKNLIKFNITPMTVISLGKIANKKWPSNKLTSALYGHTAYVPTASSLQPLRHMLQGQFWLFSGCDTTSSLYGHGKASIFRVTVNSIEDMLSDRSSWVPWI